MESDPSIVAAGFVLAGGRSSRMGQDKALLRLGGEPLVLRAVRKLNEVCADVAIAGGTAELTQFARVIPDKVSHCGALGGIVSALEQSQSEWNLFLSVDAPFVPVASLRRLLSMAAGCAGVGVVARVEGRMQPLCAVYSRRALEILQQELAAGRWKVLSAVQAAGAVQVMDFEDARWFANLNTPEEFAEAERQIDALQ